MTHELPRRPTVVTLPQASSSSSRSRFIEPLLPLSPLLNNSSSSSSTNPLPLRYRRDDRDTSWGDRPLGRSDRERPRSRDRDRERDRERERDRDRDRDPRDRDRSDPAPRVRPYPPPPPLSSLDSHSPRANSNSFEIPYRERDGPNPRKRPRQSSLDDDRRDREYKREPAYARPVSRPPSPDWGRRGEGSRRDSVIREASSNRRSSDPQGSSYSSPYPYSNRYPQDDRRDDRRDRRPDSWGRSRLDDSRPPPNGFTPAASYARDSESPASGLWPASPISRLPARPLSPIPLRQLPPHMQTRRPPSPSPPPPPRDSPGPYSYTRRPGAPSGSGSSRKEDSDREVGEIVSRNGERTSREGSSTSSSRLGAERGEPSVATTKTLPPLLTAKLELESEGLRSATTDSPTTPFTPPPTSLALPTAEIASAQRPPTPHSQSPPSDVTKILAIPLPSFSRIEEAEVVPVTTIENIVKPISPALSPKRQPSPPAAASAAAISSSLAEAASANVDSAATTTSSIAAGLGLVDDPMERSQASPVKEEVVESVGMEVNESATPLYQSRSPTPRSPTPRSPSPCGPPPDFASALSAVISANVDDKGEVNRVIEANRLKTEQERVRRNNDLRIRDLSNFELQPEAIEAHGRMKDFLSSSFTERDERRGQKMVELRQEYKAFNTDWKAHCKRLDKVKDRIHRRHLPSTVPVTPSIDSSGLPVYPEASTPGPSTLVSRPNRRNANGPHAAFGYGDAVRSEAEFLEILASLETADMRDPTVRASRTAAIVPDMVLDPAERAELPDVAMADDQRRIVDDPVAFYGIEEPLDLWTEDEVQIFCKRYSQHPKQFAKIAAGLPEKSTAQCVLFYYRMKNTIDFRSLSERRSRDGRRKKNRRRGADALGGARKSLLSNLKRARPDERDDDEDSPPPSPKNGRRPLQPETPSVFQPPETTSRPPLQPPASFADEDMDDDSVKGKKGRTPKLRDTNRLPPSESMLEAAEVLGALAGITPADGEEADDDGAGKARKRKVRLDDGAGAVTPGGMDSKDKAAAGRRKSASSSYWSVAERNEFISLLGQHGKNWTRLAEGLENKTAVQCRNWFQNHAKKLNLAEIAANAENAFDDDADEETGSGAVTPKDREFTAPTGVPLSEAAANGAVTAVPRAGFFVPEGAVRVRSPRLAPIDIPACDGSIPKAGMQIRNLLNDETPDEEVPPPRDGEDWFGGGSSHPNGDADSVTTEDESDAPKDNRRQANSPVARNRPFPTREPYTYGRRQSVESGPPSPAYYSPYAAPANRYAVLNSPWQQSPVSTYPPPFGPPQGDYYRDIHSRDVHSHSYRPQQHDQPPQHHHASQASHHSQPQHAAARPPTMPLARNNESYFPSFTDRSRYLPTGAKYPDSYDGRGWSSDLRR